MKNYDKKKFCKNYISQYNGNSCTPPLNCTTKTKINKTCPKITFEQHLRGFQRVPS